MVEFYTGSVLPVAVAFSLTTYVVGIVFAWLEIEIEGPYAWSRDNPHTWRLSLGGICLNGLPLTGYHLTMFATVFLVAMGSYATDCILEGRGATAPSLFSVGAFYTYTVLIEDYEWYVYNQDYKKIATARAPFGSCCNRYLRYVLNLCIFVPCWLLAFALRPSDASIFRHLPTSHNTGDQLIHGVFILLAVFVSTACLLVVERCTLVPLYKLIRSIIKTHDDETKDMKLTVTHQEGGEKVVYYVISDRDNMNSFRGSTLPKKFSPLLPPPKKPAVSTAPLLLLDNPASMWSCPPA